MGRFSQLYHTVAWRRVRLEVLSRDGRICQIRGSRCAVTAGEVDHIVRPDAGGAWYDVDNLRAACVPCNRGRGGRVGAAKTNARWVAKRLRPSREW